MGTVLCLNMVSYGALIFSGPLQDHLAEGIAAVLVSAVAVRLVLCAGSSYRSTLSGPQAASAAISGVMAHQLGLAIPGPNLYGHVLFCFSLSTLLTAIFLLLVGRLGWGNRRAPYAVVGGFLAGSGWLLCNGAFISMTQKPIWEALTAGDMRWLPGLGLALLLLALTKKWPGPRTLPLALLCVLATFYALVPLAQARQAGWLLGPFPDESHFKPLWLMSFHLDWGVLAGQWLNILSVPLVAALSIGLTVSSLEIFSGGRLDPNREMSAAGLANMASCLSGGLTGFHAPVDTMLSVQLGSRGRIPALVSVVVVGAVLWSGPDLLQEVPHFVLGGFILYLGLHFLHEWLIEGWPKMSGRDYATMVVMVLLIAVFGFVPGVLAGLLLARGRA